ncbi:restriction endonuclease subunit S [Clostridium botulinum]|uniref:restriction endonuclease subunit S n=1 Tax=Clostridium botulinum TaxID=1491 RepID=UPI001C9B81C7|nr:restriction endonuclease subunit S [Clostridium botulinum]MBY6809358.1 restriction endonuclease subunit S [Clostridium botulinum]MBY6822800.1 restriction endonuclease subunit S [Clostridium botulinum]MBY6833412.1 restriction endonuclease subunit S [Clostridium botulinum]MBY6971473.1 restriction endonuclease subunit S [Clostridium botulinum]HBJ1649210.1 restriction endonuclease subunit S [Clostridium botulinum]
MENNLKETLVGRIPNAWQLKTVEELIKENILDKPLDGNHGGIHPKQSDFVEKGVPFIMASDLKNGVVDYSRCKYISEEQAKTLKKGFARERDVLITHKATIGETAIVEGVGDKTIILTPQVTYYRVNNYEKLNNEYLMYYFNYYRFKELFANWAGGGSTRAYLGITAQQKLPIIIPPIEVQRKISFILFSLDNKIKLNNKMNKTLEEMAQAIFKSWFVDFEPFKDGEFEECELGMIPKGWKVNTIDTIGIFKNGKGLKKEYKNEEGKYNILGSNGVIGKTNEALFDEFVITIGRVGANYGEIHYEDMPCWVSDNAITAQPIVKSNKWFILYNLYKIDYSSFVGGSAQPLITQSAIKSQKIVIPPDELLLKYYNVIDSFYKRISINNKNNNFLKSARDTLLPKLISGEIEV